MIFYFFLDIEVIMYLICCSKVLIFEEVLKESLWFIKGGFIFVILIKDVLYGVVDFNVIWLLVVGKMENGVYILVSEICVIDVLGVEFI